MEKENNKDSRGYNLKADNFRQNVCNIINSSGLMISDVYYILKDIVQEVTGLYDQQVELEYKQFCDEENKRLQEEENNTEDKAD